MQHNELSLLLAGIAGAYNICFAFFHLLFWRIFRWPRTILPSGTVNVAITQTLNIMLTYCFVLYGGWLIWAALSEVRSPPLLVAGSGFWLLRTALQPALFGMQAGVSVMITVIFVIGVALHLAAAVA